MNEHAILSALSSNRQSVLEIARDVSERGDESTGPGVSRLWARIFYMLKQMEKRRLIAKVLHLQKVRPPRSRYELTHTGREYLLRDKLTLISKDRDF